MTARGGMGDRSGGVRACDYSFSARLLQSSDEVRRRFIGIIIEAYSYPELKAGIGRKQIRIYSGRKTVALIFFRGRRMLMTFALDPDEYSGTKYRGVDVSGVKRFAETPMMLELTSDRRAGYAAYLLGKAAEVFGLKKGGQVCDYDLPYRTTDELIRDGLIKTGAESTDERRDIAELVRERITLVEAHHVLSDEVAASLVEDAGFCSCECGCREVSSRYPAAGGAPRGRKGTVNTDILSREFLPGDTVTLDALKAKRLLPEKVSAYKVLARGMIDKPLTVEAQDFSLDAVRMIALTGGKARKVG